MKLGYMEHFYRTIPEQLIQFENVVRTIQILQKLQEIFDYARLTKTRLYLWKLYFIAQCQEYKRILKLFRYSNKLSFLGINFIILTHFQSIL